MFIAHLIQDGEGCDYMIGCGETVTVLPEEIKTMEEAEVYVAKRYAGWFGSPFGECQECEEDCEECDFELDEDWDRFNDERSFADVIIYEVSDSKSPTSNLSRPPTGRKPRLCSKNPKRPRNSPS